MSIKFRNPIHDLLYDIVDEDEVLYAQQHPDEFLEPDEDSKMLACIVENENIGTKQLKVYTIERPLSEEEQIKIAERLERNLRLYEEKHKAEIQKKIEESKRGLQEALEEVRALRRKFEEEHTNNCKEAD